MNTNVKSAFTVRTYVAPHLLLHLLLDLYYLLRKCVESAWTVYLVIEWSNENVL